MHALMNGDSRAKAVVLEIERKLIQFMENHAVRRMQFEHMKAYDRMLAHKSAELFGMDHILADNANGERVVTVIKKNHSAVPQQSMEKIAEGIWKKNKEAEGNKVKIMTREVQKVKVKEEAVVVVEEEKGIDKEEDTDILLMKKINDYTKARSEIFNGDDQDEEIQGTDQLELDEDDEAVNEPELYIRNNAPRMIASNYLQVLGLAPNLPVKL